MPLELEGHTPGCSGTEEVTYGEPWPKVLGQGWFAAIHVWFSRSM